MSAHPYADILRAIAEGRQVQFDTGGGGGDWRDLSAENVFRFITQSCHRPYQFRIKPAAIQINGIDVPEPMREEPEMGSRYYLINLTCPADVETWYGASIEQGWLADGVCHLTEEDANAHRDALLSFTRRVA